MVIRVRKLQVVLILPICAVLFAACSQKVQKDEPGVDTTIGFLQPPANPLDPGKLYLLHKLDSLQEVERILGRGNLAEGPLFVYPSAVDPDINYGFWYVPIDTQKQPLWAADNLGLLLVTENTKGTTNPNGVVVWPEDQKGKEFVQVLEEYAKQHPELKKE